ncbi:cysteine hydrolase family protein [Rhodococcus opacus]|uniref:Cysteine hydrolase n=1 Tax=Rhodococcus opacus TaxID=37919 RepID=A0A2S8JDH7_RHOOP|nr:isochorismatase family cysteine hydrolase [Rhodococcus opacus]PQP25107.1 cysteine hydrolase [Rhodococcus opacus]
MSTTEPISLDPTRTALVNVHWQRDIVTPDGAFAPFFAESVRRHGVIGTTRGLVETFRQAGALVIWARAAFQPGYPELILNTGLNHAIADLGALIDGSPGAQIIPELAPGDGEPAVGHPGTSAFPNTALDAILRRRQIDTVLFTGVATNVTVEGTARDAVNLGYNVILVSDACAAATDESHEATLATFSLLGKVASAGDIQRALQRHSDGQDATLTESPALA